MMTQLTKADRLLKKNKNRVVPSPKPATVRPKFGEVTAAGRGKKIIFKPNPNSVVCTEHSIDVSHMNDREQRNLLSILRSGQDLDGVPRFCIGMEYNEKRELILKNYKPRYDKSATLI